MRRSPIRTTLRLLSCAVACLQLGAPGQSYPTPAGAGGPQEGNAEAPRAQGNERAEAWPELARDDRRALAKEIERLRRARTDEMGEEAHATIAALGAGAAPALLDALGREREAEARARIEETLAAVTGPEHTRLLAQRFDDKKEAVRIFAMRRAAAFPDPGTAEQAGAALERAREMLAKKKAGEDELYAAALAASAGGSVAGVEDLFRFALAGSKQAASEIRVALAGTRGPEATEIVARHLTGSDEETVAALRMLAGCGDDGAPRHVRPHLDSENPTVRIAAINALRGIVDGEPPIEHLSAFDAIEMANEWKRRI